ncbi:MAG: T9SS type A sorting domain-containing protein [Saprospiraceae bacterium]
MSSFKSILLFAALTAFGSQAFAQCVDPANIYTFTFDGHTYEVVKEASTWTAAVDCAIGRNGYLAEITSEAEQAAIFDELSNNAGINTANTQNQFGTASVWLGGSDAVTEGTWIWDGDNDGVGSEFWIGGPNGGAVGGAYTVWGTSPAEPDNSGGQDHLTIILKPTATNFGRWNDLISTNRIYYLIEIDNLVSTQELELNKNVRVYPNPFKTTISIENNNTEAIAGMTVFNLTGQKIKTANASEVNTAQLDLSTLASGVYMLNVRFENGVTISQKIVK